MALSSFLKKILSKFTRRSYSRETNHKYISEEVERAIIKGIKKGESIPNITKRIVGVSNKSRNNATLIARTETTRYQNNARNDAFGRAKELGIDFKKKWVSTHDGRTRTFPRDAADHLAMDGEMVEYEEEFSNGLMFPGDDGPPEEVCNCRCVVVAELEL